MNNINIQTTEESYTSKCDHLALEPLSKQIKYLGKRIKRGLFKSSKDIIINSDINGAIGILRKMLIKTVNVVKESNVIQKILNSKGSLLNPQRIYIYNN